MKRNVFDRMSDSYESFQLQDTKIGKGNDVISISPKIKLIFGWSLFVLCMVLAYIFVGLPFGDKTKKEKSVADKQAVLHEDVNVNEEHDTIVPYEKDADADLNNFVKKYFDAITNCDNLALQDMVTDPKEFKNNDNLKKKADFITGYNNITVYSKEGLDEGSYIVFVVANLDIAGVSSSPYDVVTLCVVNGARGYMVNNGKFSQEVQDYIVKIKGDKDIQKIYKMVEDENDKIKENDPGFREFLEIISRRDVKVDSAADKTTEQEGGSDDSSEAPTDAGEGQEETQTDAPAEEATDGGEADQINEANDANETENTDANADE